MTGSRARRWRLALLLIVQAPLSGCALFGAATASKPVATVRPAKVALRDICISRDDHITEGTAQAIEANNLALGKISGRGPQCPKSSGGKMLGPPAPQPAAIEPGTS